MMSKKSTNAIMVIAVLGLLVAVQFTGPSTWQSSYLGHLNVGRPMEDMLEIMNMMSAVSFGEDEDESDSEKEVPIGRYHHDGISAGAGMAACLLWKDDNHNLIEWLAFHYHNMPMRRLIFHPDPRAKTSPMEILERYTSRGMLDVDVWNATFVLGKKDMSEEAWNKLEPTRQTNVFYERQYEFMRKCFLQLHSEGKWTWVTAHDIDEYLIPNQHVQAEEAIRIEVNGAADEATHPSRSSEAAIAESGTPAAAGSLPTFEHITMIELLELGRQANISSTLSSPCVGFRRFLFGARETEEDIAASNSTVFEGMPTAWQQSKFITYRWNWRIPGDGTAMGKGIVDLSRVRPDVDLANFRSSNPHRPIKTICPAAQAWRRARESPLVMHHYIGDQQQFMFRDDPRTGMKVTRTIETFEKNKKESTALDKSAHGWLSGFVKDVGLERATALLEGVGESYHTQRRRRR